MAGLKTSTACVKLLDIPQIAGKVIPQAATLALDKSPEIRELSLALLECCLEQLRVGHKAMQLKAAAAEKSTPAGSGGASSTSGATSSSSSSGKASGVDYSANIGELPSHSHNQQAAAASAAGNTSWSSWSMLQGISKTLESATASGPPPPPPQAGASGGSSGSSKLPSLQVPSATAAGASASSGDTPTLTASSSLSFRNPSSSGGEGWANLDDDQDLDDGNSSSISTKAKKPSKPSTIANPRPGGIVTLTLTWEMWISIRRKAMLKHLVGRMTTTWTWIWT